ncbi:hypothetical protein BC829DRAFT_419700 [Chytridium lagenaria]|nr:hypothetical protein BC829DRAFT_419700 [Chytridium lagenaria]
MTTPKTIAVTGGSGYIASHIILSSSKTLSTQSQPQSALSPKANSFYPSKRNPCYYMVILQTIPGKPITEADWNTKSSLTRNPYYYSKVLAEKAAWEFVETNPAASNSESVAFIKNVATGEFPVRMNLLWPLVDVRDVARAHIAAFENVASEGRYIVHAETWRMTKVCDVVKTEYPDLNVPMSLASNWFVYLLSYTMGTGAGSYVRTNLGDVGYDFKTEKIKTLGVEFMDVEMSVKDTVRILSNSSY